MAETEVILLKRFARSGDAEAFAEIIRRYAGLVYSAALRILADVDRASDVAQETFLQLAKDAGSVTGSLPGWLHRVATHKAIDQVRRDATRRHREAEYTASRPQEAAEWKEISPHVDEALNLLEPHLRNILIAHFLEGRSTREIARAQGVSQATISRRIETGVGLLRAGLRRRGILVAVGALSILLGENAVRAAPPVLLTELGKIALISGSLAAATGGTSAATGLGAVAASALAAVKANLVATAAVVAIAAGSFMTYRQAMKPSREAPAASGGFVVQNPAGGTSNATSDPLAGTALVDGYQGGQQIAAADDQADPSSAAMARRPVAQALPGPEAETDPRTYVPGLSDRSADAMLTASDTTQEGLPDQSPPSIPTDAGPLAPGFRPANDRQREVPWARETPYETVMRLRREAMDRTSEAPASVDLSAMVPVGPVVAKAELTLVPPFLDCPATNLETQRQDTTTVRPSEMLETPPDAPREPVYFAVRAGDRQIRGITYRSIRPPRDVVLILDTDGDGLWSDETPYVGRRLWMFALTATYEFGPVYLKQDRTEPGGDAFYPQCSDGRWLMFYPAFYRDGTVVLDGTTHRITLVDTDFDGRFNEMSELPVLGRRDPGGDAISIDAACFVTLPGGGRLSRKATMPLSKVIGIDGRYYGIEVAEDGSTIEFRRAEPASGRSDPAEQ
ncbi:MAG: sigma-70 family RNA polymerase sigma factor [Phycisphaerae bacterium]|nr:sigma-70 family RNA polymerase sigma factor [Phycisphaerae bacterium]